MQKYLIEKTNITDKFVDLIILLLSSYIFFGDFYSNTMTYVIIGCSAIILFVILVINNNKITHNKFVIFILILCFIVINIISIFNSKFVEISVKGSIYKGMILLIGIGLFAKQKFSGNFLNYFMFFSLLHTLITFFSYLFPNLFFYNILSFLPTELQRESLRFYYQGLYSGLNYQIGRNSFYITVGSIILFSYWINIKNRKKIVATLILMMLFWTAILLTGKKGSLLALILASLILIIFDANIKGKSLPFRIIKLSTGLVVLSIVLLIVIPETAAPIFRFMSSLSDGDITSGRSALYSEAVRMFVANPLFGGGYGVFIYIKNMGVHSMYLQLLADNGLFGFICFMIIIIINLKITIDVIKKVINRKCNYLLKYLYFSFLFQMYFIAYGVTENTFIDSFVLMTYIIAAIIPYTIYIPSPAEEKYLQHVNI